VKGRIDRQDLDHLLGLIQRGRQRPDVRDGDADEGASGVSEFPDLLDEDHAIWNANQEFWVEKLKSDTNGTWSDEEYGAAARIINAAEYQHVVFGDIASALSRGLPRSWRDGAQASDAPAHAAFPVHDFEVYNDLAPTPFDETFDLVDEATGQVRQVRLGTVLEDVRRPNAQPETGASEGAAATEITLARETPVPRRVAGLGDTMAGRTRDTGEVAFNLARGDLFAQCGLSTLRPYADWNDFGHRNDLPDDFVADLRAAYPDGFHKLDLWVGGLAERPASGDLGPTLTAAVRADMVQTHQARGQVFLDLLAGTHLLAEIGKLSWPDIVARTTGAAQFADYVLATTAPMEDFVTGDIIVGTDGDDVLIGTDGSDIILGGAGDDLIDGRGGADVLAGGSGNDTYIVDDVRDRVIEAVDGGGDDTVLTDLAAFALGDGDPMTAPAAASESAGEPAQPLQKTAAVSSSVGPETAVADTPSAGFAEAPAEAEGDAGVPAGVIESDEAVPADEADAPEFGRADNVENLTYTGDGDFIGIGNAADNVISGGGGEDALWGLAGDDVLYGGGGDDALFGGGGNDLLVGGYGDDRLEGGSGDDVLFIGRNNGCPEKESYGRDTIVLQPGFGSDIVIGFDSYDCSEGHDRFDVSAYGSLSAESLGSDIQITACGPHTIITINEDSITLLDVNASTIGKDDFIFS
jgi:Ca2+-binding RTX toxin-like protein